MLHKSLIIRSVLAIRYSVEHRVQCDIRERLSQGRAVWRCNEHPLTGGRRDEGGRMHKINHRVPHGCVLLNVYIYYLFSNCTMQLIRGCTKTCRPVLYARYKPAVLFCIMWYFVALLRIGRWYSDAVGTRELETSELDHGKYRLYRLARFDLVCSSRD